MITPKPIAGALALCLVVALLDVVVNRTMSGHHGEHRIGDADEPLRPAQALNLSGRETPL